MARVLIIAQHEDGALNPATAKTLSGAKGLGIADIDIAVFAESAAGVAQQASRLEAPAVYWPSSMPILPT